MQNIKCDKVAKGTGFNSHTGKVCFGGSYVAMLKSRVFVSQRCHLHEKWSKFNLELNHHGFEDVPAQSKAEK